MLNIFNNLNQRHKGIVRFPEWDYIKSGLMLNLDSTNKYYRSGAYAVGSDHEIIKLLFGISISTDTDLASYYKAVDNKALTVAQQLGFTTSMSRGHMFSDVFFSGGSQEILIVTDEPVDPDEVTLNWRNVKPIRILRHGFDTIDCFPLTGKLVSKSISAFSINLPMLALQYRAFRQWQKTYVTEESGRNSIYNFLYSYPINNMIYDAMDHAVFNRLVKLSQGLETSDNQFRHPFHVTNYTDRVDRMLLKVLDYLKNAPADFITTAMSIPMVSEDSLEDVMRLPDVLETRQINWALSLSRFSMLMFLLSYADVSSQNQSDVGKLKFELGLYLRDGTIRSAIPKDQFEKQRLLINQLLEKI